MIAWQAEFTVPPNDKDRTAGIKFEDGGAAAIMYAPLETADVAHTEDWTTHIKGDDGHFFVRLHSWDETSDREREQKHPLFRSLMGRKVKITIETIDDDLCQSGCKHPDHCACQMLDDMKQD